MKNFVTLAVIGMVTASGATIASAADTGADIYKAKCAMCHGGDGLGSTPAGKSMKVNPFSSPEIAKMSEADLIEATKKGKGKMPAYGGKLTDGQIKSVVEYVQTLQKK